MDGTRFDEFARRFGTMATRRRALAAVIGSLAAPLAMSGRSAAALRVCRGRGQKCRNDADCCALRCRGRRCRDERLANGFICEHDDECRSRICGRVNNLVSLCRQRNCRRRRRRCRGTLECCEGVCDASRLKCVGVHSAAAQELQASDFE